jgi:hypothetical protein
MKRMFSETVRSCFPRPLRLLAAVLGIWCLAPSGVAQAPIPAQGLNASLLRLFGDTKTFSARAEAAVKTRDETVTMPMEFSVLDGKMRLKLEMSSVKSKQLPKEALQQLKEVGMDTIINVVVPQKKLMWLIYPSLEAYAEMPLPEGSTDALDKDFKVERTPVGPETVNGMACVKHKVVMTGKNGRRQEGFTWNAAELEDFPLRMQFAEEGNAVTLTFSNIKRSAPPGADFEAPAGFKRYNDIQQLMFHQMLRQK